MLTLDARSADEATRPRPAPAPGRELARRAARRQLRRLGTRTAVAALGSGWVWVVVGAVAALVVLLVLLVLTVAAATSGSVSRVADAALDIPAVVLDAYLHAEQAAPALLAGCHVRWQVLAGIGKVESDHGRHGGATATADGDVRPPIIGVALDGTGGTARIPDTDGGRWDGDTRWDRAVGPMQFIPSSWRRFGQDATGNRSADPHNVYDAALAAVAHLCLTVPGDYADPAVLAAALFAYNRSWSYVDTVLTWIDHYDRLDLDAAGGVVTAGVYTLPVDRHWLTPERLRAPHHTYPAWDLPLPEGTPVYAVYAGHVTGVPAASSRCGLGAVVAGDDGYTYLYCHASTVLVAWGDRVTAGQQLMRSGNTGNSTGPHLHLGIRDRAGRNLCPQPLLVAWYEGVPASPDAAPTHGCTY